MGDKLTLRETAARLARLLEKSGMDDPGYEAQDFLSEILGLSRTEFHLKGEEAWPAELLDEVEPLVSRRIKREPLAYIIGRKNFHGRDFLCDSRVLIPRPETEILVDEARQFIKVNCASVPKVCEIGTGTGCISITLALEFPEGKFTATDIQENALAVAQENARRFNVLGPITFVKSDVYQEISPVLRGHFDMIISNPPYISGSVISTLEPELFYEPRTALDGGPDGLSVIQRIVEQAPHYLTSKGALMLEIGYDQGSKVRELMEAAGFKKIEIKKDLNGHDRVAKGVWLGPV